MTPNCTRAGAEPRTGSPGEFGGFIRREAARLSNAIREAGIQGE